MREDQEVARTYANLVLQAELYFKALLEAVPDAIILVGPDGRITLVNAQTEVLFGYRREELLDQPIECLVPERLRSQHVSDRGRYHADPQTRPMGKGMELSGRRKDGSEFPVEISLSPIHTNDGAMVISVIRDVSEQRRVSEALRHSRDQMQSILDNTESVVSIKDLEGRYLLVNRALELRCGLVAGEAVGKTDYDLFPKTSADTLRTSDRRVIDNGGPLEEVLVVPMDDGVRTYLSVKFPLKSASGAPYAVCEISSDITMLKRAEEEAFKTSKLELIGVLAGGIAHDFNNILTAMVGNLYLIRQAVQPDSELHTRVADIEKATLLAKKLTHQLLTFSRGGAPIKQRIRIGVLLEDWATFALRGSNVRCEFSLPEDLWLVEVDEGQLSQVINNLVINAQEAMPNGGTIRIRAKNLAAGAEDGWHARDADYVRISVEDEGCGISEDNLPKIFDPFFTTKPKGSGLGLAISHAIVQKHGGTITVRSRLGQGATLYIDLPAASTNSPVEADKLPEFEMAGLRGKGKILFMDDEEPLRTLIADLLPSFGYEVECVPDGTEAVERYRKAFAKGQPYDAVILDLTVPGGMGGKDAVQALRQIDPLVRAVVSSGYSQNPILANFQDYGFSAALPKPFTVENLHRTLLEVTRAPRPVRDHPDAAPLEAGNSSGVTYEKLKAPSV